MTAVRGLTNILNDGSWREARPTPKQLDFIRDCFGEDEVDRIIFSNLSRGQVADIIDKIIKGRSRSNDEHINRMTFSDHWVNCAADESRYIDLPYDGDDEGYYLDYNWDEPYYGD
jgi:hypothetical protein